MRKLLTIILILIFSVLYCLPVLAQEMDRLTLSITPPLIKNNVNPGQVWQSAVKVVNNNSREINVYVQVADFKAGWENGTIEFIHQSVKSGEQPNKYFLSQWIDIEPGPITIPAFQSKEIPFKIIVPEEAEPGGRYAAILAGTRPPSGEVKGSTIKISSLLASLILLNVKGEVVEKGQIREFSTDKKVYLEPKVNLKVRFENIGNIHIQPQGEIKIYDFFNKDKGTITINHNTEFGNVLPQSTRKWDFSWDGEKSLLAMGRYKAVLILGYGEESRETVDQTLYFWIIHFKLILITVSLVLLFIFIIVFFVRTYIKRAIIKTQSEAGIITPKDKSQKQKILIIPEENNVVNLRAAVRDKTKKERIKRKTYNWALFKKRIRVIIIILTIILGVLLYFYYQDVIRAKLLKFNKQDISSEKINKTKTEKQKDNITADILASSSPEHFMEIQAAQNQEEGDDSGASATSSEKETINKKSNDNLQPKDKSCVLKILNGSGKPGMATKVAEILSQEGFNNIIIGNADNYNYHNTVIQYKEDGESEVELISELISGSTEMQIVEQQEEDIVMIVGSNFE